MGHRAPAPFCFYGMVQFDARDCPLSIDEATFADLMETAPAVGAECTMMSSAIS